MLHKSAAIDPTFAKARLWMAIFAAQSDVPAHVDLQQARELRAALSPSEQQILEAWEPSTSTPPNWAETERRLRTLADAAPESTVLRLLVGWAQYHAQNFAGMIPTFEAVTSADPDNAFAWNLLGLARYYVNSHLTRSRDTRRSRKGESARMISQEPAARSRSERRNETTGCSAMPTS
jgi:hypothetical protein